MCSRPSSPGRGGKAPLALPPTPPQRKAHIYPLLSHPSKTSEAVRKERERDGLGDDGGLRGKGKEGEENPLLRSRGGPMQREGERVITICDPKKKGET